MLPGRPEPEPRAHRGVRPGGVLELRGKLEGDEMLVRGISDAVDGDAVSALTALGYTGAEARQALMSLGDVAGLELEERLRRALAHLSRLP